MKNCDEMTENVLRRMREYRELRMKRGKMIRKTVLALACIAIAVVAAVGIGKHGIAENIPAQVVITSASEHNSTSAAPATQTTEQKTESAAQATTTVPAKATSAPQTTAETSTTEPLDPTAQTDVVNYFCLRPGDEPVASPALEMVSSYDAAYGNCNTPENGDSCISEALKMAMEEYNSGRLYRVTVELFRNGTQIAENSQEVSAEIDRLSKAGYITAFETAYQDRVPVRSWITLHATFDQINEFPTNADYGYALYLYDERLK